MGLRKSHPSGGHLSTGGALFHADQQSSEQPGLWQSRWGQVCLGSKALIEQVQQRGADQSAVFEIPRIQPRPLARFLAEYRETIADTREVMATAYVTGDYTMQEIATCFGVHYSTASRAVSRAEQKHA